MILRAYSGAKHKHQPTRLAIAPDRPESGGLAEGFTDSGRREKSLKKIIS
jgi:hypothetical protein